MNCVVVVVVVVFDELMARHRLFTLDFESMWIYLRNWMATLCQKNISMLCVFKCDVFSLCVRSCKYIWNRLLQQWQFRTLLSKYWVHGLGLRVVSGLVLITQLL